MRAVSVRLCDRQKVFRKFFALSGYLLPLVVGFSQAHAFEEVWARKLKPLKKTTASGSQTLPRPTPTPVPQAEEAKAETPPTPAPSPVPTPEPKKFEGSVEGSLLLASGNTNAQNLGIGSVLRYRDGSWKYRLRDSYYSSEDQGEITAEKLMIEARAAHTLSERVESFANIYFLSDRFAGVEKRFQPDYGYGYEWILADSLQFRTEAAVGYDFDKRDDGGTDNYAVARLGFLFAWALSESSEFSVEANVIPSLRGGGEWRTRSQAYVSSQITQRLSLKVSYLYEFTTLPVPGKAPEDKSLTAAVVAKF
jgi:putative salt-induced outer membrane protein YdiY